MNNNSFANLSPTNSIPQGYQAIGCISVNATNSVRNNALLISYFNCDTGLIRVVNLTGATQQALVNMIVKIVPISNN